jgi:predicted ATPase
MSGAIHAFAGYELDLAQFELRHRGTVVPIEPQVFDVLAYLVEHRNRVVTKEELLDNIWGDRFVSETALTSRVKAARRAIGDDGTRQALIRTAHGRGYRFVGAVDSARNRGLTTSRDDQPRRLVGRECELSELNARYERATTGQRQLVFVAGAAGIGKTAVVRECLASLRACATFGIGQCVDLRGSSEPYWPVLSALRHAAQSSQGRALVDTLVQFAPSWVLQMPGLVPAEQADLLRSRSGCPTADRMLRELLDALAATSSETPLVLVLEDLHWSDPATLDLLEALAADPRPAPLLVVATHRPGDGSATGKAVHSLAVGLRLRQRAVLLTLDVLTVDHVGAFLTAKAGLPEDRALVALIHERTGGVPLFVEHVLEEWLGSGWLEVRDGILMATRALADLGTAIPNTVRLLIEHTADRLPRADQAVLAAAAVAGRSFTSADVSAATHQPEEDVEAVLRDLARRGIFIDARGHDGAVTSSFLFQHDLYREVLYRRAGATRITAHHARPGSHRSHAHGLRLASLPG